MHFKRGSTNYHPRSILKPVRNEFLIDVYINLPQLSITQIHEFMRHVRRDNNDLACNYFKCSSITCESRYAFLDDKYLFVGMLMQTHSTTRRHIHPNKRDLGILMLETLELIRVLC